MEGSLLTVLAITLIQILVVWIIIDQRKKMERIASNIVLKVEIDESKLEKHLNQITAQIRNEVDGKDAQDIFLNQSTAEVIKQVTDGLEAISLDKSKDVKIIVSNDKINQERFTIKMSFRTV